MAGSGRFITLEGGEGAGKSTQAKRLADHLMGHGLSVVQTREPGGAPAAERIRALLVEGAVDQWQPQTEALLHVAARAEHVAATIQPALARGDWVVCDRFTDSTMAYQGIAMGVGQAAVTWLNNLVAGDCRPDLTIIMDMPVEIGMARAAQRGGPDRYERMGAVFHEALRAAFLDIAQADPKRCVVVDGTATEDIITEHIITIVDERLKIPNNG